MWFANHFVPNLPPARPVVLLIDGHDSHLDLELFQLAEKNGVYLYSLLKNATHLVQPADVGLFGPMKKSWYKEVRKYAQDNPNTDITKKNFCSVFKATWEQVMSPSVLVSVFRKSGIYPVDRRQISDEQLVCSRPSSTESGALPVSSNTSGATQAFEALDEALSTPCRTKYRRRITESYNLDGGPTFSTWKKLYCASHQPNAPPAKQTAYGNAPLDVKETGDPTTSPPEATTSATEPSTRATEPPSTWASEPSISASSSYQMGSSAAVLREILTYLTLEANAPPKRKNFKRSIPNFVSGPESMQILLNKKLKKACQLAEKQKKLKQMEEKKEERRKKSRKEQRKRERDAARKRKDQGKVRTSCGTKRTKKSTKSQRNGERVWRMRRSSISPLMMKTILGSSAMDSNLGGKLIVSLSGLTLIALTEMKPLSVVTNVLESGQV